MESKVCNACKTPKRFDEFGNNKSKPDGKQPYCRACGKERDKRHYAGNVERRQKIEQSRNESKLRNRKILLEYLRSHPCVDCGESEPLFLDFDHVRGEKRLEVSTAAKHGWSTETLIEEMKKCDVRCIRCHRIKTAKEQGWFKLYAGIV